MKQKYTPRNMRRLPNVGLPLGQRRRRWANCEPTLSQPLSRIFCKQFTWAINTEIKMIIWNIAIIS